VRTQVASRGYFFFGGGGGDGSGFLSTGFPLYPLSVFGGSFLPALNASSSGLGMFGAGWGALAPIGFFLSLQVHQKLLRSFEFTFVSGDFVGILQ